MEKHGLYPLLQSAYRKYHSTEIALLKVHNDILMKMDSQRLTLLVLLDLSEAFDIVDHDVLLNRLSTSFGVRGCALHWFASCLYNKSQRVSFDQKLSENFQLAWGVPQGSCLGPLLFMSYSSKLFEVIKSTSPKPMHMPMTPNCIFNFFMADSTSSQIDAVNSMEL